MPLCLLVVTSSLCLPFPPYLKLLPLITAPSSLAALLPLPLSFTHLHSVPPVFTTDLVKVQFRKGNYTFVQVKLPFSLSFPFFV